MLIPNNIYINLEIGEPKQKVEAFLVSEYEEFFLIFLIKISQIV